VPERTAAVASTPEQAGPPQADDSEDTRKFEEEIRSLLELAGKSTYYELLGVTATFTPSR